MARAGLWLWLPCRTTTFSGLPLVMDNWTVTAAAGDAAGVLGSA